MGAGNETIFDIVECGSDEGGSKNEKPSSEDNEVI